MEFSLILIVVFFIIFYRMRKEGNVYKFIVEQVENVYEKITPYSFKQIREKVKELGLEYSAKEYAVQIAIFAGGAFIVSYLYFYSIVVSIFYVIFAVSVIPYLAYLRFKKVYSEYIFEQIQVYTTNTIMEFAVTESFVKALEGVYSSGVLEDPVLSDLKHMIDLSYENGSIDASIEYMNSKYDYYVVRNMHQLFLQITKEGSLDSSESMDGMLIDIDMLVDAVYRDRIDRTSFHKSFVQYGIMLYLMVMLVQYLLGVDTYLQLIDQTFVKILLHIIILVNSYFLITGERYYNENVGVE